MALIAVELRIRGRIQRVGYRRYVLDLAQEEDLVGYVRNERDGSVTILAQGDKSKVAPFVKKVSNPPPPAMVKEVHEVAAKPNSRLRHFGIIPGRIADELQEGFGTMQSEFRDHREEFRDHREEFKGFATRTDESFEKMNDKYGEISAKFANILETLRKESVETRRELTRAVDNLAKLIDEYVKRQ